jgi:hypothetical protein
MVGFRAGLWPSEALSYVKFMRPLKFEIKKKVLTELMNVKSKHETDVVKTLFLDDNNDW